MTDGSMPDRLAQLKARWESDPSSRIFLQLAEEYRHQGRMQEALAVLDRGLQEHPGYLSALVAKGRCHLELGEADASRSVLERVVKQDATQMVANKLLVRAYLETGDPARARERLDLYSLLNDGDPEIGDLRRQIKLMDRPKERERVPENDIFDLGEVRRQPAGDVFALEASAPAPEPEEVVEEEVVEESEGDLFPGLVSHSSRERYLTSLASEGIFEVGVTPMLPSEVPFPTEPPGLAAFAPPTAMPEEPPLPAESDFTVMRFEEPGISEPVEDASWLEDIPVVPEAEAYEPAPVFEDLAPLPPPAAPVEEPVEDLWADEPEPAPVQAAEPAATATLGEIYLRQGHADEAERIFREVLEREPEHGAALAGLERIEETRQSVPQAVALDANSLLAGFRPGGMTGGTTARKVFLLSRYLERIRGSRLRGSSNVS
ncbi:MAG TPA: tetratricopeptide repeat protein [Thermoanaerobaculia bacterium]|jgi:tetratricopeptide (TPR) repeat protein|nr:tetratricopeptide repeat protein [Thermoanaerobaculia bacterium]